MMITNKKHAIRSLVAQAGVTVAVAVLLVGGMVPANASGTSASTNGCYGQWYNTYAKGMCYPATANGRVQLWVDKAQQPDCYGGFVKVYSNTNYTPFDDHEAWFEVRYADVNWRSQ